MQRCATRHSVGRQNVTVWKSRGAAQKEGGKISRSAELNVTRDIKLEKCTNGQMDKRTDGQTNERAEVELLRVEIFRALSSLGL